MRALWILIVAATPVFGQEPPPAPPPVSQLPSLETLIKNVPFPKRAPIVIVKMEPRVCAIPLLVVTPKTDDSMTVVKPQVTEPNMPQVAVPAPACKG